MKEKKYLPLGQKQSEELAIGKASDTNTALKAISSTCSSIKV